MFYGKKDNTQIFAIPGNPAAALTCFYIYVYITLQQFMDRTTVELPRVEARAKNAFDKRGDRPQFLKGIYKNGMVELLDGQSSSMLQTFALSNALVFIPAEVSRIEIDSLVTAIVLPA